MRDWPQMTSFEAQNHWIFDLYGRGQSEPKKIKNPEVEQLEIKMIKNAYPFGATIDKHMMNDDYDRSNWPSLFNYGVATVSDQYHTKYSVALGTTHLIPHSELPQHLKIYF